MKRKPRLADALMAEVILYGGVPVTRADAYRICFEDTGDKRCADLFAFGPNARRCDYLPFSIPEFRAFNQGQ